MSDPAAVLHHIHGEDQSTGDLEGTPAPANTLNPVAEDTSWYGLVGLACYADDDETSSDPQADADADAPAHALFSREDVLWPPGYVSQR